MTFKLRYNLIYQENVLNLFSSIAHHKGTEAAHSSLFASGGECGADQASEIQALHSWYR